MSVRSDNRSATASGSPSVWPNCEAGMVLCLLDGTHEVIHPDVARKVIDDGILERMRLRVEVR